MSKEKTIKTINFKDFKKLNLEGRKHCYKNGLSFFEKIDLAKELEENYKDYKTVIVALHEEPKEDTIEYLMQELKFDREEAYEESLYNNCYPVINNETKNYLIIPNASYFVSSGNYWTGKDGIKINKLNTKEIYKVKIYE